MMDNVNLPHKKRRRDGNFSQKYNTRYIKNPVRDENRNWHADNNFRDENRFHNRQGNNHAHFQDPDPTWDIQINLIGMKVRDPMIHVCEICSLPIKSYGRMIPCKHVFCFSCAKKTDNNCPRCKDSVQRIEQCPLGSVWLCAVTTGCKRTYLSQRDLQAHINHRHNKPPASTIVPHPLVAPPVSVVGPPPITVPPPPLIQPPPNAPFLLASAPRSAAPPIVPALQQNVVDTTPTPRPSRNLITIQIQDSQSDVFPPPPPPGRPPNQPQLFTSQSQQTPTVRYQ